MVDTDILKLFELSLGTELWLKLYPDSPGSDATVTQQSAQLLLFALETVSGELKADDAAQTAMEGLDAIRKAHKRLREA